ncbi:uncharacterized protein V1510DRAFT_129122 [Dipodascopsis tothii]|uniref:uncharacterized protein n=1 Tax=Dipodascopsis tothii TaxID=44089 RepID=UPI0034CDE030
MRVLKALWAAVPLLAQCAAATRLIKSTSLETCMENSDFSASLFNVVFTPENRSLSVDIVATSTLDGNVTGEINVIAYGLKVVSEKIDPCTLDLAQLCPMSPGQFDLDTTITVSSSVVDQIPGVAYTVPDLDGTVQISIYNDEGTQVACVEAQLSNGKTVHTKIVAWVTAVIAGLAMIVAAIASGMGHSSTSTHVAANTLSLFGYFQNLAVIGMCAMKLPPITSAWTQDFEWSMGIIRVGFMQKIFDWYIKSTGGTPSTFLDNLSSVSVLVQKRSVETVTTLAHAARHLVARAATPEVRHALHTRVNNDSEQSTVSSTYVLHGIKRVAYLANIEITSMFVTGVTFFVFFTIVIILCLVGAKFGLDLLVRTGVMRSRFTDFRVRWLAVVKGMLYRMVLIGSLNMIILSFWELTQRESPATVVLAVVMLLLVLGLLAWASFKVIKLAKRSVAIHKNPAYILYSDPVALNRWGFVYVQFRATAYYFIVPSLLFMIAKACFIAFGQNSGTTQGIALFLLELAYLVLIVWIKPYMDRATNAFNISIQSVNFVNGLLFLFFTRVTKVPAIAIAVMGVVFFVLNAAFAVVLMIMVAVSCVYALLSKNPDKRYQPMRDDRASFIKSSTQLPMVTELEALGATARGGDEGKYMM